MRLFRAISAAEKESYSENNIFYCTDRTLTVKQFFKSLSDTRNFVEKAVAQSFSPPYSTIVEIELSKNSLNDMIFEELTLDTWPAISFPELNLQKLNENRKFITYHEC